MSSKIARARQRNPVSKDKTNKQTKKPQRSLDSGVESHTFNTNSRETETGEYEFQANLLYKENPRLANAIKQDFISKEPTRS